MIRIRNAIARYCQVIASITTFLSLKSPILACANPLVRRINASRKSSLASLITTELVCLPHLGIPAHLSAILRSPQIINLSTLFFNSLICGVKSLASFVVILAAITALDTPHALPKLSLLGTYTYGQFLSSATRGRWRRMARGDVSAARMMSSAVPRLRVLVAAWVSETAKSG